MLQDIDASRKFVPTPEASQISGLSKSHITRLLKSEALEGFQLGRDWFVYTDSLERYIATPHKPGPKGPIKRKSTQEEVHIETPDRETEG